MSIPRPNQHLRALMQRYPQLPRAVDTFRAGKGVALPEWPAWCFVPMAAWHALAMRRATSETILDATLDIAILGALAPWRYTQGIYRIDADVMAALVDTEINGILPAGVFYRLPQWSVYIETPGMVWLDDALHGFWAHLEYDTERERSELRLLLDTDDLLFPAILHLGAWAVREALRRSLQEGDNVGAQLGLLGDGLDASMLAQATAQDITPLLSILLYLCADEPEIDDEREPGVSLRNPQAKRVKAGLRLFPPDKPRIWRVGAQTGATLRAAQAEAEREAEEDAGARTPRTIRTHLRRAHWHGYWTGVRADPEARRFVYHWLPPTIVQGSAPAE